jgi:hypothetical protein|tara:strand:- start:1010 stop:1204 length:195 start_codon:yes stop_codon:yes gene_type:complete
MKKLLNEFGQKLIDCVVLDSNGRELSGECPTIESAEAALRVIHQKYYDKGLRPSVYCDAHISLL